MNSQDKQEYLRREVILKGYKPEEFVKFVDSIKTSGRLIMTQPLPMLTAGP